MDFLELIGKPSAPLVTKVPNVNGPATLATDQSAAKAANATMSCSANAACPIPAFGTSAGTPGPGLSEMAVVSKGEGPRRSTSS